MSVFNKAEKKQAKLRLAIFGPSGSGKTYSSLSIAQGLGSKIALIDTENRSACKYADKFSFDVAELDKPTCANMSNFINQAKNDDVLAIDSLTHAWQELLEEIDRVAASKYRGNKWSAWSEGTPKQKMLVKSLLNFPGHVIATMRTKTEWITEQDTRSGKLKPVRVGLSPEQGKGIEYEFDMLMEINTEHSAHVIKDRTGKFQDEWIEKPGKKFGTQLNDWLKDGKKVITHEATTNIDKKVPELIDLTKKLFTEKYITEKEKELLLNRITGLSNKKDADVLQENISKYQKCRQPGFTDFGVPGNGHKKEVIKIGIKYIAKEDNSNIETTLKDFSSNKFKDFKDMQNNPFGQDYVLCKLYNYCKDRIEWNDLRDHLTVTPKPT